MAVDTDIGFDHSTDLEYPYVVLHPEPGLLDLTNLAAGIDHYTWAGQVTAVGRDHRETVAATDRARAALVGRRPTVPGRECNLIRQEPGAAPVTRDPDATDPGTGRPVFFTAVRYSLHTTPA
jgi:hypothetical protein